MSPGAPLPVARFEFVRQLLFERKGLPCKSLCSIFRVISVLVKEWIILDIFWLFDRFNINPALALFVFVRLSKINCSALEELACF